MQIDQKALLQVINLRNANLARFNQKFINSRLHVQVLCWMFIKYEYKFLATRNIQNWFQISRIYGFAIIFNSTSFLHLHRCFDCQTSAHHLFTIKKLKCHLKYLLRFFFKWNKFSFVIPYSLLNSSEVRLKSHWNATLLLYMNLYT